MKCGEGMKKKAAKRWKIQQQQQNAREEDEERISLSADDAECNCRAAPHDGMVKKRSKTNQRDEERTNERKKRGEQFAPNGKKQARDAKQVEQKCKMINCFILCVMWVYTFM